MSHESAPRVRIVNKTELHGRLGTWVCHPWINKSRREDGIRLDNSLVEVDGKGPMIFLNDDLEWLE